MDLKLKVIKVKSMQMLVRWKNELNSLSNRILPRIHQGLQIVRNIVNPMLAPLRQA